MSGWNETIQKMFADERAASPATEKPAPIPAEALDRFERAAMAYERLGKMTRDDEKTRNLRKEIIAELAGARRAVLALADRASQEERIREDERDALFLAAERAKRRHIRSWIGMRGGMFPADRARQRGDAS